MMLDLGRGFEGLQVVEEVYRYNLHRSDLPRVRK